MNNPQLPDDPEETHMIATDYAIVIMAGAVVGLIVLLFCMF